MSHVTRRQILFLVAPAGVAAIGAAVALRSGRSAAQGVLTPTPSPVPLPPTLTTLTLAEYFALAAACERIFPRDDTPGALDLGAPQYVDRALSERAPAAWSEGLRAGLIRLDAESSARFSTPFYRASPTDQDALLRDWESGADDQNADFFRNLVAATLEGALGDPRYGGNAGGAGWERLGFPVDPFAASGVHR